jgi:hypothetical protein
MTLASGVLSALAGRPFGLLLALAFLVGMLSGCGSSGGGLGGTPAPGLGLAALSADSDLGRIEQRIARHEAEWGATRDKRAAFATTYRISTRNFRKCARR